MPAIETATGSQRAKPTTRSSIRHSLGFASVGKALADVINKEGKGGDKNAKLSLKESRRLSAVSMAVSSSRTANSSSPGPKVSGTPDSKTITRRRASLASTFQKPSDAPVPQLSAITRSASLRPRPVTSSGLPKYRPKSAVQDVVAKKAPSPVNRSRKRPNTSDKEDDLTTSDEAKKVAQKASRPISPLPHRAALKANMSRAANVTPPATPTKLKQTPPLKTSTRPNKIVKVTPVAAPSSSTSSTNSLVPRTPKTPKPSHSKASPTDKARESSSSRNSHRSLNESPLSRHSRQISKTNVPAPLHPGNMSHISEGGSDDGDEEDVELLLAPVAVIGAPTPAMPRILTSRQRKAPETPSRSTFLPSRSDLSYASPQPPTNDSPASLRPQPTSRGAPRGSILSWEQLADEASRTLGEDEIQNMISDVPAPFQSGTASPMLSTPHLELPDSPCLSAMNSPGGYGSISQVLLPDVTPSPAIHTRRQSRGPEVPVIDGAIVTLLRLQLESSEHTAKERRIQLQSLEEELHHVKDAHVRDVEQLSQQIQHLEDQLRSSLEVRERSAAEQALYIASLENQLNKIHSSGRHNTNSKVVPAQDVQDKILRFERLKWGCASSARVAARHWTSVKELAEMELNTVKSDQDILSLLLGELDLIHKQLAISV
ncbi:hypothetical protein IW262DRAFT_1304409 [Armillaria fumosa]|nr:hypothetical protein IW262DRAFT_1304409 [Armillaria fumosa]